MTYKERINFIADVCKENNIPFEMQEFLEGYAITFPWINADIVCHNHSYGHSTGYVESMGFPWDKDDVSILTPEDAAKKIVALYNLM